MSDIEINLWEEYYLNEIKIKKDILKQLLPVNALLIGAYSTLLFNSMLKIIMDIRAELNGNFIQIALRDVFNQIGLRRLIDFYFMPGQSNGVIIIAMIFSLSPVIFWYLSINKILVAFRTYDPPSGLSDPDEYYRTLLDIDLNLNFIITDSCYFMEAGLAMIVVLIILYSIIVIIL